MMFDSERVSTTLLFIVLIFATGWRNCYAWSSTKPFFFPLPKGQIQGGQNLVDAGQALCTAADCFDVDNLAYPNLLRDAGSTLSEAGEAWSNDNWEAVAYAADDCSSYFFALSQLQTQPTQQKVYKGASGELKVIAGIANPVLAAPNLVGLSNYLKEAGNAAKKEKEAGCNDVATFRKSLRDASKSIRRLAKELQ